ncbi:murein L,D-transpeptidase [Terriglobus sp. RCC_193]|uniref:L,D-transpeptidase family protein n=1 Tax=Terriglobus sp. RCC_193 TaxID=3239218 RepID=UPI0035249BFB
MQTYARRLALVVAFALLPLSGCKRTQQIIHHATSSEPDYTPQILAAITPGHMDGMKYPDFTDIQAQVNNLYDAHDFDLLWVKGGKPTAQADAMLQEFSNAMQRGLRPEDYDSSRWDERVANLKSPEGAALFDVALTVNTMRYLNDLHQGRTNPAHFTFGVKGYNEKKLDVVTVLNTQIIAASDVTAAVDAVEPQSLQYKALKTGLKHYLDLVPQDHIALLPEMNPSARSIAITAGYPALQPLQQKLALLGDYSGDANVSASSADLTEALKHFQHRHGLNEDGKLGSATIDALNTPTTARVTQIADTMERWRWLNDDYQNAAIVVNLPEFELRAFEGTGSEHHEVFRMNVVDGKSDDDTHHTPVIAEQMKYLVFRPYWNVPPSIARKEIIPHMQKQPGYLSAKNYETVDLKGNVVSPNIAAIDKGTQMVRQKAGTSNSLGLVKFMFPNQFNVYLHDTNEKALFARTRRDYSHGCVRLQDPPKLANWLLRDNSKWDEDSIADAMNDGQDNKTVLLPKPIPVVVFYGTAWSDDGEMHFFRDMYGYDDDLEKTLNAGRPYPQKPMRAVTEKDA